MGQHRHVPDAHYLDEYLVSLYDRICVDRADEDFYLHLIQAAGDVMDIGCGTGTLLNRARVAGHRGRLVGLDPAEGMLRFARRYRGIGWVRGTLSDAGFDGEFELLVMTGHAFQVLLSDDDLRAFLVAARRALTPGGTLAFETRNPRARAWDGWTPDHVTEIRDDHGQLVRVSGQVESVEGEYVTFTQTYSIEGRPEPLLSRSTLRFVSADHLDHLLTQVGFAIEERYGDWDRSPFTPTSPEIITVARRPE
jgi:SAM-dependent methyltransferase